MAKQVQLRRGTTAENDKFTGAPGEVTVDTDLNTLRVHDGKTPGGTPLARQGEGIPAGGDFVVESQMPTAANNYTWYRKYKSGWVEQGGRSITAKDENGQPVLTSVILPVVMQSEMYTLTIAQAWGWPTTTDMFNVSYGNKTKSSFQVRGIYGNEGVTRGWTLAFYWFVSGPTE